MVGRCLQVLRCKLESLCWSVARRLVKAHANSVHEKAAFGLSQALDVFGHDNVAILSNSAGTKDDKHYEDAIMIEKEMGINVIRHDEKKPGGLKEVLEHFKDQGVDDASQVCMVGDRLLTDVLFGNLYGMLTVHCLPLCSGEENKKDNKIANVIRKAENNILYTDWWFGRTVRKCTIPHSVWKGNEKCPLVLNADLAAGAEHVTDKEQKKD